MCKVLVLASAACVVAANLQLPYWAQPFLDPLIQPYGGASLLPGVEWTRVYFASPKVGTYAMSPMIGVLDTLIMASWKVSAVNEDQAGQHILWAGTLDGVNWLTSNSDGTNVLFPPMNSTESPNIALFAEPFLSINGRFYAAASPRQFCLYPDQFQSILLLRQIFPGALGHFGSLFWAGPNVPSGFAIASATHNVTVVTAQDAQTQADIATLVSAPTAAALPCDLSRTTKCEACEGGCQDWAVALNVSTLENERSHFKVPLSKNNVVTAAASNVRPLDVLLYRSHARHLFASVRANAAANWSVPAPTNITDDVANFNAGNLADGRAYLISNAMLNAFRDPLFVSTSSDGLAFDHTVAFGSCEQSVFANPPHQPWGCLYRHQGGAKESGLQYAQGMQVISGNLSGFYVVVSQNKEDIWVGRAAAIP